MRLFLDTPCGNCSHGFYAHREHFSEAERQELAVEGLHGCLHGTCGCDHFAPEAAAAPQTPAAESRLVEADERQVLCILQLAHALGRTIVLNWDQFPTGMTKGLSMAQMGGSALVRATAQLLASSLQHLPDNDPRRADALEVHVEMLRDHFAQACQDLKDHAAATAAAGDNPPTQSTRVFVPQPTLLM